MRIAVFHNLPPGGARRAAFELVRATSDAHHFDLFTVAMADPGPRDHQDLAPIAENVFTYELGHRIKPGPSGRGQFHRSLLAAALLRLHEKIARDIDARGYDLAFLHHDQVLQSPAVLRFLKTPSVYYVQEPRRQSFEYDMMFRNRPAVGIGPVTTRAMASLFNVWFREAEIKAARGATQLVVNSYHSLEFVYRAYGRYPVVSYLGVDPAVFAPLPSAGAKAPRSGVVAVGALDRIKGHDLVIEALGLLPAPVRPGLTIVFERERPGVRRELTSLARAREVHVDFLSSISDEELARVYRSSVATVCAASVEPFGLTTVESLATGTPVVAVREGGYREVLCDGENGYLVPRDPSALADGIERAVRDADRWSEEDLRATVLPHFSWQAAGERIDRIFAEVVSGRSLRGRPGSAAIGDEHD